MFDSKMILLGARTAFNSHISTPIADRGNLPEIVWSFSEHVFQIIFEFVCAFM